MMEVIIKLTKQEKDNLKKAKMKVSDFAKIIKKVIPKVKVQ